MSLRKFGDANRERLHCGGFFFLCHLKCIHCSYSERVDSYSFAIVMWEFMTREWAFDEMDVEEIIVLVRDDKERPDVPDWCPRSFNTLLTECWSETPLFRPSFENIVRRLDVMLKV